MKILVLNCGSSSIKYQVFALPEGTVIAKGLVQKLGEPGASIRQSSGRGDVTVTEVMPDHTAGLKKALELLTTGDGAPLASVRDLGAIGHRVVHGGERFTETVLVDDEVLAEIERHNELAPLHNPPNLVGIRIAREVLPGVPNVAVFDTAFHQTMPKTAYLYAIPQSLYREAQIRRYGFHGTSHRYVAARTAELLGKPASETNLITCHLGNGTSICAIEGGRSVDTSMGLTPLEGLVMGTRAGDFDPAIIFHLERVRKMDTKALDDLFNKKSGLLGVSGKSNDVRELLALREKGDADAALAIELFTYRLKKYIGAYLAVLDGRCDAVVFTAGIGENSPVIREESVRGLERLGVALDRDKNASVIGREANVSASGSATQILVVPTNEEKLIAMDTYALTRA
ncbi:acetate kinase [Myxococcota bacterium]|nr:acetate kinase [Myxococcota bacterium]